MTIISGQSNTELATKLAQELGVSLAQVEFKKFQNGEKFVQLQSPVTGESVVIVQSFSTPVDENIIELLLLVDAAERAGAREIRVIIPWMGYSLQDKMFAVGQPISARVIADIISSQRIQQVYLIDLHNASIPGFFSVPTQVLSSLPLFAEDVRQKFSDQKIVVVSPDIGALKQTRVFGEMLGAPMAFAEKQRDLQTGDVVVHGISGENVAGAICIVADDIISTGGTLIKVAEKLKEQGASQVHFYATHGLFAQESLQRIAQSSALDSLTVTDTVSQSSGSSTVEVLSVAKLLSHALRTSVNLDLT